MTGMPKRSAEPTIDLVRLLRKAHEKFPALLDRLFATFGHDQMGYDDDIGGQRAGVILTTEFDLFDRTFRITA
jgi:hypothetical protein